MTVLTNAHVSKVLIKDQQAYGVEVVIKGERSSITAKKEVILSGGTIASPQLLMLLGIGDKNELNEQDIDCVHELKGVGKNLQKHLGACVLVKSKKPMALLCQSAGY